MKVYLIILLVFLSPILNAQSSISYSRVYEKTLDSSKNKLIVYKSGNNYLFEVSSGNNIREQIAFVNADLILPLAFDTLKFIQKNKVLVSDIGVFGSTFGANNYLILWNDGFFWNLAKTPFVRCVLAKTKSNIAFDVYDYQGAKKKQFIFAAGLFLEER